MYFSLLWTLPVHIPWINHMRINRISLYDITIALLKFYILYCVFLWSFDCELETKCKLFYSSQEITQFLLHICFQANTLFFFIWLIWSSHLVSWKIREVSVVLHDLRLSCSESEEWTTWCLLWHVLFIIYKVWLPALIIASKRLKTEG